MYKIGNSTIYCLSYFLQLIINNQSAQPSILNEHKWSYPGLDTIKNIMRIAWASGGGDIQILTDKCSNAEIHDSLLVNRPPILEDGLCKCNRLLYDVVYECVNMCILYYCMFVR